MRSRFQHGKVTGATGHILAEASNGRSLADAFATGLRRRRKHMFEGPVTGNIPEVLDNGDVTDGTHVTAGQLALALTPYAQVTDLAVNTAASGNNAAAIQSLDDRVTAELASKLDSSALAPAIAPLATAAALATTDGQVAARKADASRPALHGGRVGHAAGGRHQDSKCPAGSCHRGLRRSAAC